MTAQKYIRTKELIINDESSGEVEHNGLVTRSPNGQLWKLNVDDSGVLTTEQVEG